jgi:uncharacterized protein YdhG (YjbR/CyaY superfamily)
MQKSNKKVTKAAFTEEELAAMRETAQERRAGKVDGEKAVLEKISQMPQPDRGMAEKIHALVKKTAPDLKPKTWYGMPAYANADGKVVCFFQSGHKYQSRYCTFGFQDTANLDEGNMWATGFALEKLTPVEEKKIATLVKKAAS